MATKAKRGTTKAVRVKSEPRTRAPVIAANPTIVANVNTANAVRAPAAAVPNAANSAKPVSASPASAKMAQPNLTQANVPNVARPVPINAQPGVKPLPKPAGQVARPLVNGHAAKTVPNGQMVTRLVPIRVQPGQTVRVVRTSPRQLSSSKKLLLAAIPGFFGLMGLSQLYQGKRTRGLAFFFGGVLASFLSSWYIIIPARFEALAMKGVMLSPYALSFFSSMDINASLAGKLSVDLMGVVVALWGLQLFDAMGPFISKQTVAVITSAVGQKVAVPMPTVRRAIAAAPNPSFSVAAERKPPT
jgi:hypothetical protein